MNPGNGEVGGVLGNRAVSAALEAPLAGLRTPGKIVCVGLNYRHHAREVGAAIPASPVLFAKWPTCLTGPDTAIVVPDGVNHVDYEAELLAVIGKTAKDVEVEHALEFVSGYTAFNDVSSRADQTRDGQWTRGKSYDTFGPIGPRVVPASEIPDPQSLTVRCRVDGRVVQDGSTADMIFSVAEIVSIVSHTTTLLPGDLIATGTPAGVGMSKTPPLWLAPGMTVEVEIERIGVLRNYVT